MSPEEADDGSHTLLSYVTIYFKHLVGFVFVVVLVVAFHLRKKWLPTYRRWRGLYSLLETGNSFQDDIDQGLSSSTFNLDQNLALGDSRKGLEEEAKKKIIEIMNSQGLDFDEARARYLAQKMEANKIAPDGTPLDPRAFTFS